MDTIYKFTVQIAGITIAVKSDNKIIITDPFIPFLTEQIPNYTVCFHLVNKLPSPQNKLLYNNDCFSVYGNSPEERLFFSGKGQPPYAYGCYHLDQHIIDISYLESGYCHICESGNSFFHIGWEEILLKEKRIILHSCGVGTEFGGLLFSGVSGIGKSTQGELWIRYEKAFPINGDRPIVFRTHDGWIVSGSPYAGSSNWHKAVSAPVRAIVLLRQSSKNTVTRLSASEAFRKIYPLLIVEDWNLENTNTACDMIEKLVSEVSVYELSCTPTQDAVTIMKEALQDE